MRERGGPASSSGGPSHGASRGLHPLDILAARFSAAERPPHPAALPAEDLLKQCDLQRSRTGGPGGQRRNKVETAVTLRHLPSGLEAQAAERRSVAENRPVALRRLRLLLAVEHREPVPAGEARSALWRQRCREGRVVVNPKHEDYPALLAEAMDFIEACAGDVRTAATRLDCTPTQLVRLLRHHPPALARVDAARAGRGEHPLQ